MATSSDGAGNSRGGRRSGRSFVGERVAGLGHGELGDRADLAGLELADGLLLLAVQQQELADPLVLVAGRVPDVRLGMERPRQDPQVRQPPDERVGGRLEHADQQRAALVGRRPRPSAPPLSVAVAGGLVGRGGEVADDRVEQAAEPDALGRRADEHRREDALLDALAQAGLELGVGDLLAVEVLRRGRRRPPRPRPPAAGRGGRRPRRRGRRGSGSRPRSCRPTCTPCGGRGRHSRRTTRPPRSRAGAARSCCRRLARSASSAAVGLAFSRSDLLMKKQAAVPGRAAQGDGLFEAGLDAGRGVHDEQRPVGGREALDDLGDEVRVARRVDQRDPRPVVLERADREAQRLAALLLLGLEVEVGACRRPRGRAAGSPRP